MTIKMDIKFIIVSIILLIFSFFSSFVLLIIVFKTNPNMSHITLLSLIMFLTIFADSTIIILKDDN